MIEVSVLQSLSLGMQRNVGANPNLLIPPASAPLYPARQVAASLQGLDSGLWANRVGHLQELSEPSGHEELSPAGGLQLLHCWTAAPAPLTPFLAQ